MDNQPRLLAANLGAQELIGMSASGAKYGIMTAHFYWLGAVPAMLFVGGLTSAIYNEVLQFFLIVFGFAPLSILALAKAGGWQGMSSRLPPVMTHTWKYLRHSYENPMGVEIFGMVAGLAFVLSFGYW